MNSVQPALVAILVSCGFEANSQEGHWLVQARTAVFMRNDNASSCDAKKERRYLLPYNNDRWPMSRCMKIV